MSDGWTNRISAVFWIFWFVCHLSPDNEFISTVL